MLSLLATRDLYKGLMRLGLFLFSERSLPLKLGVNAGPISQRVFKFGAALILATVNSRVLAISNLSKFRE